LSSWVNGLSAPQDGKSGWGNPLWLKNDIYKKVQIFDLKKQAKSLILAPESCYFHRFEYSYAVSHKWQKLGKYNKLNFCIKSWVEKSRKMRKKLNTCNFPILPAPQIFLEALFSLHYQNLGGFGGVFKVMERRKYKQSFRRIYARISFHFISLHSHWGTGLVQHIYALYNIKW